MTQYKDSRQFKTSVLAINFLLLLNIFVQPVQANVQFGYSHEQATVTVGCLYPLSGKGSLYGMDSIVAMKLALKKITKNRLSGSPKIRIIVRDSKSKMLPAIKIAHTLIQKDNADFLCGIVSSGIALEITKVAYDHQVFFIGTDHWRQASEHRLKKRQHLPVTGSVYCRWP